MRGNLGSVFVSSTMLCCVEWTMSGLSQNWDVSVTPNPDRWVGFESVGNGDGDSMFLGL